MAWQSGAVPAIILTKADLAGDSSKYVELVQKTAPVVGVYAISTLTGDGMNGLGDHLKPGKTIVLLGSSGVGKSTFVNALAGSEIMEVKEIREDNSRGRHTTTHRQMILMPGGYMIIDTPGMRELGMWDVDTGLGETFTDVESYFDQCKFTDCRHDTEPGCAIKMAIQNNELSEERWNSYLRLKREAKFVDDKSGYIKAKEERFKEIAKINRNHKKKKRY
jgi:ribosome biogenesis GTPase